MSDENLSERKKRILKAIVEAHIAYGEPVGSKYLAEDKQLSCSSATIRNEMAELEALGYLEQPHTSAGRVPSELGYRFYVDSLTERYTMTKNEIEEISSHLQYKISELDSILLEASRLASSLTNYTGLAAKPKNPSSVIARFEAIYIDKYNFVLVMMTQSGVVKTKYIRLNIPVTNDEITLLASLLNTRVAGVRAELINMSVVCDIERMMGRSAPIVAPIIKTVYQTMTEFDSGEVQVEGVNRLLQYPEYADIDRFRDLLGVFEHKEDLLNIISKDSPGNDDVNIRIGRESEIDVMSNSAMVYKTIKRGGRPIGVIGVIGPCRMDYSKVIATINQLAAEVDRLISDSQLPPGNGRPPEISGPEE